MSDKAATNPEPEKRRDVRIDTIMMVEELVKFLVKPIRDAIKERHQVSESTPIIILSGDVAEAKIEEQPAYAIDAGKFFALYESGQLSRKEFLACITIGKAEAKRYLGEKRLDEITVEDGKSQKMTISRKKGTTFNLSAALKAASEAGATADAA